MKIYIDPTTWSKFILLHNGFLTRMWLQDMYGPPQDGCDGVHCSHGDPRLDLPSLRDRPSRRPSSAVVGRGKAKKAAALLLIYPHQVREPWKRKRQRGLEVIYAIAAFCCLFIWLMQAARTLKMYDLLADLWNDISGGGQASYGALLFKDSVLNWERTDHGFAS